MSLKNITDKLTMLQDDFGEEEAPDGADNSSAPTDPPPAPPADPDPPEDPVAPSASLDSDSDGEGEGFATDEGHEEQHSGEKAYCHPGLEAVFGDCEISNIIQLVIQAINVVSFFVTVVVGWTAQYFMAYNEAEILKYWTMPIDMAGWGFELRSVIGAMLGMFVFYQMVPSEWILYLGGTRNDEMLFLYINLVFALNMMLNAAWNFFFLTNTQWGFILSWLTIVGVWVTNTYMMVVSQRFETWWLEVFMVRIPLSLYSGWVTFAMVLNTFYMLKSWGMHDDYKFDTDRVWMEWLHPMMFINEEEWTIIALWAVGIFYEVVAWWERNPVWGSVYTWALSAMITEQAEKLETAKDDVPSLIALIANTGTIVAGHEFSMTLLGAYLIFEELQPWYEPISFWNGGILGLTDWSLMFTHMKKLLGYFEDYFKSLDDGSREALI